MFSKQLPIILWMVCSRRLSRDNVEKLGFKFTDIKILLISHAHWDHNAASDTIKELTGAKYMVMEADMSVVESGGKTDFQYGAVPATLYAPTKVDRRLTRKTARLVMPS